jgi:hypothetical protein
MTTKPHTKADVKRDIQRLDETAKELLEAARKLPPGPARHDSLKEVGRFRARIIALRQSRFEKKQPAA